MELMEEASGVASVQLLFLCNLFPHTAPVHADVDFICLKKRYVNV